MAVVHPLRCLPGAGAEKPGGAVDEVGGSALRMLHQLAASRPSAEAIARATPPTSGPLMAAMAKWGLAGSVLALETIARTLVLGNRCCTITCLSQLEGALDLTIVRNGTKATSLSYPCSGLLSLELLPCCRLLYA